MADANGRESALVGAKSPKHVSQHSIRYTTEQQAALVGLEQIRMHQSGSDTTAHPQYAICNWHFESLTCPGLRFQGCMQRFITQNWKRSSYATPTVNA